jgi:hypothetical protein
VDVPDVRGKTIALAQMAYEGGSELVITCRTTKYGRDVLNALPAAAEA